MVVEAAVDDMDYLRRALSRRYLKKKEWTTLKELIAKLAARDKRVLLEDYDKSNVAMFSKANLCPDHKPAPDQACSSGDRCTCKICAHEMVCQAEVKWMKEQKVNSEMSLNDVFITKDTHYTTDPHVAKAIESIDQQKCPFYFELITDKFARDDIKHELVGPGAESLGTLIKTSRVLKRTQLPDLPSELRTKIISYLELEDVSTLIKCRSNLKAQVYKKTVGKWNHDRFYLEYELSHKMHEQPKLWSHDLQSCAESFLPLIECGLPR